MSRLFAVVLCLLFCVPAAHAQIVPADFKVELIYKSPDIEHPSALTCDNQGNLFVAEDPMDMRGPANVPGDRILLIRWDKETGKPIKTVFAEKLNAVFGLAWHAGKLYVMHAPTYSVLEDTNGDGIADTRKDLIQGIGMGATLPGMNDHSVTGIRLGLDGWMYASCGDKGIAKAVGPTGQALTMEGGGVIRFRPDGTQMEIFSTGTRNHLSVAMDSHGNLFSYDNSDDGAGWWTRVIHHVQTGYYGYPYDYHKHPERHLPCVSEHGGGAPAGGDCYRGDVWPEKYRDNAFFCEWGKGKIQHFTFTPKGATFTTKVEDFFTNDGSGDFRPLDLCFSLDGRHMYIADWNFGGWLKPERYGRLFRVTYVGPKTPTSSRPNPYLAAKEFVEANRLDKLEVKVGTRFEHLDNPIPIKSPLLMTNAVWIMRVLGERNPELQKSFARYLIEQHAAAPARLEAAITLGRSEDQKQVEPLWALLNNEDDPFAWFAARQALCSLRTWEVKRANPRSNAYPSKSISVFRGVYDPRAVHILCELAIRAANYPGQIAAIEALADVHRQPEPYTGGWWGTQPALNPPKRPKTKEWSETEDIAKTIAQALMDPTLRVRQAAVNAAAEINDPRTLPELIRALETEQASQQKVALTKVLAKLADAKAAPVLIALVKDVAAPAQLRQEAVRALTSIPAESVKEQLLDLVADEKTPAGVVVLGLAGLAANKSAPAIAAVEQRLRDNNPSIRAAAVACFAQQTGLGAAKRIAEFLRDPDTEVRELALHALAELKSPDAVPALIQAAQMPESRFEATHALTHTPDRAALAIYLDGLLEKNQTVRDGCRAALVKLKGAIGDDILALSKRNELSPALRRELQPVFSPPEPLRKWHIIGPWSKSDRPKFDMTKPPVLNEVISYAGRKLTWQPQELTDKAGRWDGRNSLSPNIDTWAIAYTTLEAESPGKCELVFGSNDEMVLSVNGEVVHEYLGVRGWTPTSGREFVDLKKGTNHVWFLTGNVDGPWYFSLMASRRDPKFAFLFDQTTPQLDLTAYREFALKNPGDPVRGQKLFADAKGLACAKCHAVGGVGAQVGPDLRGVGAKYPRDELIRSMLEPSNRVAESYRMTVVTTAAGKPISGIIKSETDEVLELVNAEGRAQRILKKDIDERMQSNLSLMPNGLQAGLSLADFADVVTFLESLKTGAQ